VRRVVVLAGGSPHAHDFVASGAALAGLAAGAGYDVCLVDHPDHAAELVAENADALAVCGLWWRMHGDAYDVWRDDHAYSPPTRTRDALARFVRGGGGMLAVHTAPICFDDWPEWGAIVGGSWQWGTSSHPPYGPVRADVVGDHPVVAGLTGTIEMSDEVYGDLAVGDDVEVLALAKRDADDDDQPVMWAHRYGRGRVVFDGFGHDVDSIVHPQNARVLIQALAWITELD